jgi:hypothetical protein
MGWAQHSKASAAIARRQAEGRLTGRKSQCEGVLPNFIRSVRTTGPYGFQLVTSPTVR